MGKAKRSIGKSATDNAHRTKKMPHGQDLTCTLHKSLGLTNRRSSFSTNKVPTKQMPAFYNIADVTLNIADAEGFGLAT